MTACPSHTPGSPFVELNEDLEKRPFGAPGLGEFVASQPREAAVRATQLTAYDALEWMRAVVSGRRLCLGMPTLHQSRRLKRVKEASRSRQGAVSAALMAGCTTRINRKASTKRLTTITSFPSLFWRLFLLSQAVRKCVDRLWLVQQDFFKHVSGLQSPHPVLYRYQHMFKGIKVGVPLSLFRSFCASRIC